MQTAQILTGVRYAQVIDVCEEIPLESLQMHRRRVCPLN